MPPNTAPLGKSTLPLAELRDARRDGVHLTVGTRRVFRHFAWLEVGSVKMALSRPTPPDRACRDHQYPYGA